MGSTYIPLELLQNILSRVVGLKANIQASAVCKTWHEAAVSVRKLQRRRPWLFHRCSRDSPYILVNPLCSQSQKYKLHLPDLEGYIISCCKDGWMLMTSSNKSRRDLFLNPFTKKHFYLPSRSSLGDCSAFSAAPTSTSCVVISIKGTGDYKTGHYVVINTWRPGEAAWTTHQFWSFGHYRRWNRCVFTNGLFYCLSASCRLGVFDQSGATWNLLPVKPCLPVFQVRMDTTVLMTEHDGKIFVIYDNADKSTPRVFKLNLKQHVWEEKKRDLGGLTLFASWSASFMRAGLSAYERNRIYPSCTDDNDGISLGDGKSSSPSPKDSLSSYIDWVEPPPKHSLSKSIAWVEPPDDFNVNLL